jgi:transposase-like protein
MDLPMEREKYSRPNEQNEGAKFWLRVMNELKNRGVEDVLIAVVDGLKGFPEAIIAVFPQAMVQTCVVHLLRHSLDFVSWKDRKPVAAALKDIYRAVDAAAGEAALTAFEDGPWGKKYPAISQSWRRAGAKSSRFMRFPPMSGGFYTLPMLLRRSIPSCAERFGPGVISPVTKPPPSSSSWS